MLITRYRPNIYRSCILRLRLEVQGLPLVYQDVSEYNFFQKATAIRPSQPEEGNISVN